MLLTSPLRFYVRMFARPFWTGMAFLLITNLLDGFYPLLIRRALDQVSGGEPWSEVMWTAAGFFALMSGLAITRYAWRTFFSSYHTAAAEDMRRRLFQHLTELDPNFFARHQIGELMSLLVNDVQAFRAAIGNSILILVDGAVIVAIVMPIMWGLNPSWTMKTLVFLPLVPVLILWVTKLIFSRYKVEQEKLSRLSGYTQETITGIRVIKGFAQERTRLGGYRELNLDYERQCNRVAWVDSLFGPIMEFGVAAGSVILIFISAPDLLSGAATVGTFVAFQRYITKLVWPMTAFGFGFSQYQKGMASFERIKEILQTQTAVPDEGRRPLERFRDLRVQNLSYSYPEKSTPALHDLSFEMKAGEKLGIVGAIGSGKSTLAHLLTRLLPSPAGTIQVNGHSLAEYPLADLRQCLRLVPQEPLLFSMSVEDNLRLAAPERTRLDVETWLERVQIKNEIEQLPRGLETELGERGVNLSGGQKQRLSLARGFLLQSDVLILDDSLSAVDVHTEQRLIRAIEEWQRSMILISHRLTVLRGCDKILVLTDGQREAFGTWDEVRASSPFFRQLCEHQEVAP